MKGNCNENHFDKLMMFHNAGYYVKIKEVGAYSGLGYLG